MDYSDFVSYSKKEKKIEIKPQLFWVEKDKKIVLPKNELWLLAPNPEDYPEELKRTEFGKSLMKMTEKINVSNLQLSILREGSNRKSALLKEMGDGEISEQFIKMSKGLQKDALEMNVKEKEKPTSSFIPQQRKF